MRCVKTPSLRHCEDKMTQAAQLIQAIRQSKKRGMTYGELEALRISTCPWKRIEESGKRHLMPHEELRRRTGKDGLIRFFVERRLFVERAVWMTWR